MSSTPDGTTVKLKGLPFKATSSDVLEFFSGFALKRENVHLTRHPDGRPNGEAFIVFENASETRRAMQLDRKTFCSKFGDRYVRVYPTVLEGSDLADMQAAASQQQTMSQGSHPHSVVKIKSLPFDATQLDIIQFFDSFRLKPNGVQLVVRWSDHKPTGEAFVDFESPDEAARAIREKDHIVFSEKFGDRYVRLIQVSRKEMQATLALRFGGEGVLKIKGIPFKATAADVRRFFSSYKIKGDGVSFIMHADGRPTGMAFIEFETPQEAVRAMEKDRDKFGPEYGERFCMLQLVGRHEMDKVSLLRESDATPNKLLNLTALQAAALAGATQAALNPLPPALHPLLLANASPWMQLSMGLGLPSAAAASAALGLVNPGVSGAAGGHLGGHLAHGALPPASQLVPPLLDPALAAQLQLAGSPGSTGLGASVPCGAFSRMNLLPPPPATAPMQPAALPALEEHHKWMPPLDATASLLLYQSMGQQWA